LDYCHRDCVLDYWHRDIGLLFDYPY
jgi:hypothetical protein